MYNLYQPIENTAIQKSYRKAVNYSTGLQLQRSHHTPHVHVHCVGHCIVHGIKLLCNTLSWYTCSMEILYPTCHSYFLGIHAHPKACVYMYMYNKKIQVTRGV